MTKVWIIVIGLLLNCVRVFAQPKLVVVIVIDQMRYNYLQRFSNQFQEGGFNKMVSQGFVFHNHHFNYSPTTTAPGHASIVTGTVPAIHGIADNYWYDSRLQKKVYCTEDPIIEPVGSADLVHKKSPALLNSTTIGDQLRLQNQMNSKVIGIALKDRSAILSAGLKANGAYWLDGKTGNFVTSNYYTNTLPDWVKRFNNKNLTEKYLKGNWELLLPEGAYQEPDNMGYEGKFKAQKETVFPYRLPELKTILGPELISRIPAGNTVTTDFAIDAIEGEVLGKDDFTDLLFVSFSATDLIGHQFGPHSRELHDTYLRLDLDLQRLLKILEEKIGIQHTMIVLTSDHGVADAPGIVKSNMGYYSQEKISDDLKKLYKEKFEEENLLGFVNNLKVYLHKDVSEKQDRNRIYNETKKILMQNPAVLDVIDTRKIYECNLPEEMCQKIRNGIHNDRSGDFIIVPKPGWLEDVNEHGGSSHTTGYAYDTHAPLIFYGWKIPVGESYQPTSVTDIAPTLSYILKCMEPSGCLGKPIVPLLEKLGNK